MMRILVSFLKNRSGATAIEYGLIAAAMAVVIVGAVQMFDGDLDAAFATIGDHLNPPPATQ